MDKRGLVERLLAVLEEELAAARRASEEAAAYATDGEARARSKWETQGLEASYLAAGQAGQAQTLATEVQRLRSEAAALAAPRARIEPGAVVAAAVGGETDWYFVAPVGGGNELTWEGKTVTVITPRSPLYGALQGRVAGARVRLASGAEMTVERVG